MIDKIAEILSRCNDKKSTNLNPSYLYCEGWMTRLLVTSSIKLKISVEGIDFGKIDKWYSEGLLSSPFLKHPRDSEVKLAEGHTHADMALGNFSVGTKTNTGEIQVDHNGVFGVIEAKMGSKLDTKVTNAKNYNQASRNLACIAHTTLGKTKNIFFAVAAPEDKIDEDEIGRIVSKDTMIDEIKARYDQYKNAGDPLVDGPVIEQAKLCKCSIISYESWIAAITDSSIRKQLDEFRRECYNLIGLKG